MDEIVVVGRPATEKQMLDLTAAGRGAGLGEGAIVVTPEDLVRQLSVAYVDEVARLKAIIKDLEDQIASKIGTTFQASGDWQRSSFVGGASGGGGRGSGCYIEVAGVILEGSRYPEGGFPPPNAADASPIINASEGIEQPCDEPASDCERLE